jgi:thiamine-monophosphate kinase
MRSKRTDSLPSASQSGELALIRQIRARAGQTSSAGLRLGIGDDCALLRPRPGEELAVTTDLSIAGRHFRLDWHPPESVGHRVVARGLSDLAAMGARPVAAFLSLGVPREQTTAVGRRRAWVERFLDGLLTLAAAYKTPLAGGDLSESPLALADIVLIGAVPQGKALLRSTARPGHLLYVTGGLGGAAAGLARLAELAQQAAEKLRPESVLYQGTTSVVPQAAENKRRALAPEGSFPPISPQIPSFSAACQAQPAGNHPLRIPRKLEAALAPHLYPQPRIAQGLWLVRHGLASAAIDLSDGLSTDLAHLCEESGVSAEVDAALLPIHPGATLEQALHGGEDYELLFTAPATARLPRKIAGVAITRIGRILPVRRNQPIVTLLTPQGPLPLEPRGWEHFS